MKPKSRIVNISTRYLTFYRTGSLVVMIGVLVALVAYNVYNFENGILFSTILWPWLIFNGIKANRKTFKVEFDDDYLYVIRKNHDTIIPLENIKSIELKTLAGLYRIDLMYADAIGPYLYFKPSLLYPFNYPAKDALADLLRKKVDLAKRRVHIIPANALHS